MPRERKTDHGAVVNTRVMVQLKRRAQAESWAWRFAVHEIRVGWQDYAACKGTDTAAWFDVDRTRRHDLVPFCDSCPVRLDCGREAMETEQRHVSLVHGVRAGFGPNDRYRAARVYDRLTQTV
jgi:carboxylesterase type B